MSEQIHLDQAENSEDLWAEFDAPHDELAEPVVAINPFADKLAFMFNGQQASNVSRAEQTESTNRFKSYINDMMLANIDNVRWMEKLDANNLLFQYVWPKGAYLGVSLLKRDELSTVPYEVTVCQKIDHGKDEEEVSEHRYAIVGDDEKLFRFMDGDVKGYAVKPEEIDGLYELVAGATEVFNPSRT